MRVARRIGEAERGIEIVHAPGDITASVTPEIVARMFPQTRKANIVTHLPSVLAGLRECALGDRQMVLMALATIRAESEGFLPISEGISGFNTRNAPSTATSRAPPRATASATRSPATARASRAAASCNSPDATTTAGWGARSARTCWAIPNLANDGPLAGPHPRAIPQEQRRPRARRACGG